jgi:sugar lactone lactonase YvrE
MQIHEVNPTTYVWGESVVWDERYERLYFVDCLSSTLHWLEGGQGEARTLAVSSMPTGLVPTEDGRLLVALDDGLHVVDPDRGAHELVAAYPAAIGGRCNDLCADPAGNVVTGKLNLGPAEGAAWQWSAAHGWRHLDDGIANTNGPAVVDLDGVTTLLIGDTSAHYYAYAYDPEAATVGERRVFGDVSELAGAPDGATVDAEGGYWCALVGGAQLARFTTKGLDRTVEVPAENPTDVTFGGPDLDRMYVPTIGGPVLVIEDVGATGRLERRARL